MGTATKGPPRREHGPDVLRRLPVRGDWRHRTTGACVVAHQGRDDVSPVVPEEHRQEASPREDVRRRSPELRRRDPEPARVGRHHLHQADSARGGQGASLEAAFAVDDRLHEQGRDCEFAGCAALGVSRSSVRGCSNCAR
jgi:hypothetical protein